MGKFCWNLQQEKVCQVETQYRTEELEGYVLECLNGYKKGILPETEFLNLKI